jgi:hypothetical protein
VADLALRHFLCGECAQREIRIHRLGSDLSFATLSTNVHNGPLANTGLHQSTVCHAKCSSKTPPTLSHHHTNLNHCVQHSNSALKIVSNTAKSVFKVCF